MKKKLLILLCLFSFMLPLSGCGEDEGSNANDPNSLEITAAIDKGIFNESKEYSDINDCVTMDFKNGRYSVDSSPQIIFKFYYEACTFVGIDDSSNGYQRNLLPSISKQSGVHMITYSPKNLVSGENRQITAYFIPSQVASADTTVEISGIYHTYYDGKGIKVDTLRNNSEGNDFSFPRFMSGDFYVTTESPYPFPSNTSFSEIFLHESGMPTPINFNYVFINGKVQPYKVTWKVGSIDSVSGLCNYKDSKEIDDINNLKYTTSADLSNNLNVKSGRQHVCLAGYVDTTKEIDRSIINTAIEHLVTSEIYVYQRSSADNHNCDEIDPNGILPAVAKDCFYFYNMKGLYNLDAYESTFSIYYGVEPSGKLESVKINGRADSGYYYLCGTDISDMQDKCNEEDVYWHTYDYVSSAGAKNKSYKNLAISWLIDILQTGDSSYGETDYRITVSDIEWGYSWEIGGIVPIALCEDGAGISYENWYQIVYLNEYDGKYYEHEDVDFPIVNNSPVKVYNLQANNPSNIKAFTELVGKIKINKINLMAANDDEIITSLTEKFFKLVNSEYTSLKGYYFTFEITEPANDYENPTVMVSYSKPIVNIGDDDISDDEKILLKVNNSSYCDHKIIADSSGTIRETVIANCVGNGDNGEDLKQLFNYVYEILKGDKSSLIFNSITMHKNENEDEIYTYKIYVDEATSFEVIYDSGNKTFSNGDNTIMYLKVSKAAKEYNYIEMISNTQSSVLGDIVQSLKIFANGHGVTSTTIAGENLNPDLVEIEVIVEDAYKKFYSEETALIKGAFYDVGDSIRVFVDTEGNVYIIDSNNIVNLKIGDKYYDFALTFAESLVTVEMPFISETIEYIRVGERICTYENRLECDQDYNEFIAIIEKLIDADKVEDLNILNYIFFGYFHEYTIATEGKDSIRILYYKRGNVHHFSVEYGQVYIIELCETTNEVVTTSKIAENFEISYSYMNEEGYTEILKLLEDNEPNVKVYDSEGNEVEGYEAIGNTLKLFNALEKNNYNYLAMDYIIIEDGEKIYKLDVTDEGNVHMAYDTEGNIYHITGLMLSE